MTHLTEGMLADFRTEENIVGIKRAGMACYRYPNIAWSTNERVLFWHAGSNGKRCNQVTSQQESHRPMRGGQTRLDGLEAAAELIRSASASGGTVLVR